MDAALSPGNSHSCFQLLAISAKNLRFSDFLFLDCVAIHQTVDKKLFSPRRGRIALSANERIAEFLDFAIQNKFAYVNKLLDCVAIHEKKIIYV